jgi:transcriptional regulator with XRE-family HTH domain
MMPKKAKELFERNFVIFRRETDVRAKRKKLGLTQQELATKLGVSRQFISLVEKGYKSLSENKKALLENATEKGGFKGVGAGRLHLPSRTRLNAGLILAILNILDPNFFSLVVWVG